LERPHNARLNKYEVDMDDGRNANRSQCNALLGGNAIWVPFAFFPDGGKGKLR
jgi:hypothetical protein